MISRGAFARQDLPPSAYAPVLEWGAKVAGGLAASVCAGGASCIGCSASVTESAESRH